MTEMIADDIRRLEEQERLLRFSRFSPDDAWALGKGSAHETEKIVR